MIRSISLLTGAVETMSEGGWEAAQSPDGSRIVFVDGHGTINVAGNQWDSPRVFLKPPAGDIVASVHWLPGGRRIGYLIGRNGAPDAYIQTRTVEGGDMKQIAHDNTETVAFAPDGRVFYTTTDRSSQPGTSLWTTTIDSGTGEPTSQPVRLASWPGVAAAKPLTLSADGKRLVVTKALAQSDIYQLTLDASGNAITASRQLTTDTQVDWPSQWAPDGATFLFYSNRDGSLHAFRQSVASENPQSLFAGPAHARMPQLTADGKWIVYLEMTSAPDAARVMRVPKEGGPPQQVASIATRLGTSTLDYFGISAGTMGMGAHSLPDLRCPPRAADGSCLLLEAVPTGPTPDDARTVLKRVDPATGHEQELAAIAIAHVEGVFWDPSPDGSTVAFGEFAWEGSDHLTLLRTATAERSIVQLKDVGNPIDIAWAADGRSLFAATFTVRGGAIVHVNLDGTAHPLRAYPSQVVMSPRPSPDGRSLLIGLGQTSSNVWLIER